MLAGLNPSGGLRTAQLDRQGNLLVAHSALSMGADAAGRTRGKRGGYPDPQPESACTVRDTLHDRHRHAVCRLFSGEYRR